MANGHTDKVKAIIKRAARINGRDVDDVMKVSLASEAWAVFMYIHFRFRALGFMH